MKVGLISDTHGHLDPAIATLFRGVEHILHAGDIGPLSVLLEIEDIAPVTAVLGNNDFGLDLEVTKQVELAGRRILVHHILDPSNPPPGFRARLARTPCDAVVFGHSHRAASLTIGGTLYVNPGYAGRPRFGQPRSVAILHCEPAGLRPEFLTLP
jgi:hypothetical protein